jgi:hypothetical protein
VLVQFVAAGKNQVSALADIQSNRSGGRKVYHASTRLSLKFLRK